MARFSEKRTAALEAMMKDEVFRVAVETPTEHGPEALTMDRLATAIGVSRGTLYNYFADRDAVLMFVEGRLYEPFLADKKAIIARGLPASETLTEITRSIFDHAHRQHALMLALHYKDMVAGARRAAQIARHDSFITTIAQIMETGMETGELRRMALPEAAITFVGAIIGHFENMANHASFRPGDEITPALMDLVLSGIVRREPD